MAIFTNEAAEIRRLWSEGIQQETHMLLVAIAIISTLIFLKWVYAEGWRVRIYNIKNPNE
jgi:hypothetical protein